MPAPSWERGTSGPFEGLLRGNHDLAVEHEGRDEEQPEGRDEEQRVQGSLQKGSSEDYMERDHVDFHCCLLNF